MSRVFSMRSARQYWVERHGEPESDSDRLAIAMMTEYGRYVKEVSTPEPTANSCEFSTFPTLEEFRQWRDEYAEGIESIYDYFRTRIQPLEIGREYEFQHLPEQGWYRKKLLGFKTTDSPLIWQSIRPIQPDPTPKREVVLEAVKNARNAQDGDMLMIGGKTIDAVIKLLEGSK
jgi:hypothetical protein